MIFERIARASQRLVQPSLVPIYKVLPGPREVLDQVGTGFLIGHGEGQILVTAKHALRGPNFDEDPLEKVVIASGYRLSVGQLAPGNLVEHGTKDVSIIRVDGFQPGRGLPSSTLTERPSVRFLTIHGYLARDFRRKAGRLAPAPWVITNSIGTPSDRWLEMKFPRNSFRDSGTERLVSAPRPHGLSGGPMLDSIALLRGEVRVLGVFVEQSGGKGRVEWTAAVKELLAGVPS